MKILKLNLDEQVTKVSTNEDDPQTGKSNQDKNESTDPTK